MLLFYFTYSYIIFFFFFFQAEDGIRDLTVTGVQTCALPILTRSRYCWPLGTQSYGRIMRCAAPQAHFQERHSPIACLLLESSIDASREPCSTGLRRS